MASDTEELLAWSTLGLAIATGALVVVGLIAAVIAIKSSRRDGRRRRAETTISAVNKFLDEHDRKYRMMLDAARAITEQRRAEAAPNTEVTRCRVDDLMAGITAPEVAVGALEFCLNELERVGVGARLGVYDTHIVYHLAKTKMATIYDIGEAHIKRVRSGAARHRPSQPTAWEHAQWLVREAFEAIRKAGAPPKLDGALDDA